jgi:SNF2 family DNA or RNA helicase
LDRYSHYLFDQFCEVYPIIVQDTIDERIFDLIEDKRKEVMKVIDNIDYKSNVSDSVLSDVVKAIKQKYAHKRKL